jgi:uncharacterized protein YjdB
VVIVEEGLVTAVGVGEATVYATTTDGSSLTTQCLVEVYPTSIAGVDADGIMVKVVNKNIVVCNAPQGSLLALYNTSGVMLTGRVVTDETTYIGVEYVGVYIVKVDNVVRKVVLK